ncbi:hypothetical protein M3936_19145 [Sutcliffiella horikoshii]|uniref:hypothetical protein n=1 Tax=Sutcliffiella horikoshii TaxID=79883 RepID=UPI00204202B6|nr:hypothetical protein [Sutcliffiella horikoshii]MCM3619690.1 hypothetical protein [Sutcliffiella horikoshii]
MIYLIIGIFLLAIFLLFWINNIIGIAALIVILACFILASLESLNDKLQELALGVMLIAIGLFLCLTSAPIPMLSELIEPNILKVFGSLLFLFGLVFIGIQVKYNSAEKN